MTSAATVRETRRVGLFSGDQFARDANPKPRQFVVEVKAGKHPAHNFGKYRGHKNRNQQWGDQRHDAGQEARKPGQEFCRGLIVYP